MEKIDEFIQKLKNDDVPVSSLLREARTLFQTIGFSEPSWITTELQGYKKNERVPKYRQTRGEMKAWNPYYGWVPVLHKNSEIEESLCTRGTGQSIREIEELLADGSKNFRMPYPASLADKLIEGNFKTEVSLFISRSSLVSILEVVRNRLLDLAFETTKQIGAPEEAGGEVQKVVGGMRLPGGIAIGPLMFSKDGKTASATMGPAIIPFDYGITNSLNSLNRTNLSIDEFQASFNSQVEDLVAEMLIYFQNRLKPIIQTNVGQFNSVDRCVKEYAKNSIDLGEICDINFLLAVDNVRGRKHHSDRRYDADYSISGVQYDTIEKLRELNRRVHAEIHALNDSLATTHKDYDVRVIQTPTGMSIEFTATSHAFDLTRGGKVVPKKTEENKEKESTQDSSRDTV